MASNISIDLSSLGISWSLGESYRVAMDQGFVFASTGLKLPVSANTNLKTFYAANTAPAISSTYPVNYEASSLENQVIDLGIDRESLTAISGTFDLYNSSNVLVKSFTIANTLNLSSNVAGIDGGNIKMPINFLLEANSFYYVTSSANIVQDSDGFVFEGIANSSIWSWTTALDWNPEMTVVLDQTYNEDTITAIESSIIVEDIYGVFGSQTGTYNMTITSNVSSSVRELEADGSGGSASWSDPTLTVSGTLTEVNQRLANLTLTPYDDYEGNITLFYELTTPTSNVYNRTQSVLINQVNTETLNLSEVRGYYQDDIAYIMQTNPIQIGDSGVDENEYYSVYLDIANGGFAYPDQTNYGNIGFTATSNLNITGSKNTVNSILDDIRYFPDLHYTSNTSFTYTQIRNNVTQVTDSVTLNFLGNITPTWANIEYHYSTPGTYEISLDPGLIYYGAVDVVLVGGGGGGGNVYPIATYANSTVITGSLGLPIDKGGFGSIGGYGALHEFSNIALTANTITSGNKIPITVGAGGNAGVSGGSTTAFGNTAPGGYSGVTTRIVGPSDPGPTDTNNNERWFDVSITVNRGYVLPDNPGYIWNGNAWVSASGNTNWEFNTYWLRSINNDNANSFVTFGWKDGGTWYPHESESEYNYGGTHPGNSHFVNGVQQSFGNAAALVSGETYWCRGYTSVINGNVYSAAPLSYHFATAGSSVLIENATTDNHPEVPSGKYGWGGQNGWRDYYGYNTIDVEPKAGSNGLVYIKPRRK